MSIDSESLSSRQRDRGFRDAMMKAGLDIDESLVIPTPLNHEAAKSNTLALIRRAKPPTAIVTRHDMVAMGACDACISEGLSVPGDVSITGVADIWNPNILKVALTTVRYQFAEIASKGVEILIELINGAEIKPETIVMGAELVVRQSTAPPNPKRMR